MNGIWGTIAVGFFATDTAPAFARGIGDGVAFGANQIAGKGFSLVEVISSCPTNWGMTPEKALEWIDEKMVPYYPLGVYKDRSAEQEAKA